MYSKKFLFKFFSLLALKVITSIATYRSIIVCVFHFGSPKHALMLTVELLEKKLRQLHAVKHLTSSIGLDVENNIVGGKQCQELTVINLHGLMLH